MNQPLLIVRRTSNEGCGEVRKVRQDQPHLPLPSRREGDWCGSADGRSAAFQGAETDRYRTVAVDIGRSGALALFVGSDLVEIADMPVLADGPACRPTVNASLLAALIRRWAPAEAVVEHVSARPGEAPSGAFAFGRSRGVIEGVLGAQTIPIKFTTPAKWKRAVGIPPGAEMKDRARSVAIAHWPHLAEQFARKLDHDRAEACLIGYAYLLEQTR